MAGLCCDAQSLNLFHICPRQSNLNGGVFVGKTYKMVDRFRMNPTKIPRTLDKFFRGNYNETGCVKTHKCTENPAQFHTETLRLPGKEPLGKYQTFQEEYT